MRGGTDGRRGDERTRHPEPDDRCGRRAEPPPADPHAAVEQDDCQRQCDDPLDCRERQRAEPGPDIRRHSRADQEERRSGNPQALADPAGQHRRGPGQRRHQHCQAKRADSTHHGTPARTRAITVPFRCRPPGIGTPDPCCILRNAVGQPCRRGGRQLEPACSHDTGTKQPIAGNAVPARRSRARRRTPWNCCGGRG